MEHFTASSGARIAYSDEGVGRPLVLLHGLMAHGGFFSSQRSLSDRFRLVAIDLPGHGEVREGAGEPTIAELTQAVAELLDSLGLDEAIGVGWSLGATLLWRLLAGPSGARFAGAVVIDMTPRVLNDEHWSLGLSPEACDMRTAAMAEDFPTFAAAAGQAIFAQPLSDRMRGIADWAGAEFARNDPRAIAAIWRSLMEQDLRPLLPRIGHPTLIVRGAHSQLYGAATADHLAATLPNARAITFEHSGHAPHIEQPEQFNSTIREFADSLRRLPETEAAAI